VLPEWPTSTIAVLATADHGPPRDPGLGATALGIAAPGWLRPSPAHIRACTWWSMTWSPPATYRWGAGVDVSEPFHFGPEGRAEGMHPERQSSGSFVTFNDPDGNNWLVQEVTERSPGLQ
jgi:hypothetical protein